MDSSSYSSLELITTTSGELGVSTTMWTFPKSADVSDRGILSPYLDDSKLLGDIRAPGAGGGGGGPWVGVGGAGGGGMYGRGNV